MTISNTPKIDDEVFEALGDGPLKANKRLFQLARGAEFNKEEKDLISTFYEKAGAASDASAFRVKEVDNFVYFLNHHVEIVVRHYLANGGSIHAVNGSNQTLLQKAVRSGDGLMASVLMAFGAVPNDRLQVEASWQFWRLVAGVVHQFPQLLTARYATILLHGAWLGVSDIDTVQMLVKAGAYLSVWDGTLLNEVCRRSDDDLALYLIESGANFNTQEEGNWSARTFAKRNRKAMPKTWAAILRFERAEKNRTALTKVANNASHGVRASELSTQRAL